MKKTPKIKHPNLHYKINTRKKTPKKNTNFQISSKKTPRKKHQFCKFSKKTPTDKTPISEKGQKNTQKKHLPDYHCVGVEQIAHTCIPSVNILIV